MSYRVFAALLAAISLCLLAAAPSRAGDRYAPAGGCFTLVDAASGADLPGAQTLRFRATRLGEYLLLTASGEHLTGDGPAAQPSRDAEWRLEDAGGEEYTATNVGTGQPLAGGARFRLQDAAGCAEIPEIGVSASGTPGGGRFPFVQAKGLIETHLHGMAFEFLGGSVHCGRPWHPYGPAFAMVDCPDHGPNGQGALVENFLAYNDPTRGHHTDGWPTFKGWPHYRTYTHEQAYYTFLERAWRGGLRLYTNLLVDNAALCELYPLKRNSCNEMETVRLQARDLLELVDYVDAQHGGPGKGWLRLVKTPWEARRVINDGKLALVMGIETSELFDCGEYNRVPQCTREDIDRFLDEFHGLGVRQMEVVNKFDNALTGVTGDAGATGILTNAGNFQQTGHFMAFTTCEGPTADEDHDKPQPIASEQLNRDELVGGVLQFFLQPGIQPIYPEEPHCNQTGLTELGAYLLRQMIQRGMIFDPDHMSVRGRDEALSIMEAANYGGVMSSHSWSTPSAYKRILALGGLVTPAPKTTENFLEDHKQLREWRNERFFFGTGFSTDMNGFAAQGGPREGNEANPVVYPFKSLDGSVMLDRHQVGERTYDLNTDGTAHFGLYPDRIEDIRIVGGPRPARDLLNGAEAYLQMWERAEGVRGPECRAAHRRFIAAGLGEARIGMTWQHLLRSAGQPDRRPGRVWTWCVNGRKGGSVKTVLTKGGRVALVASTARLHRARGLRPGARSVGRARRGLVVRPSGRKKTRMVHGVRRGRVTFVGVASRSLARKPARLRAVVRRAGLR